jgi:type IV pilus assembly protein PilW
MRGVTVSHRRAKQAPVTARPGRGFTLVEVLVALTLGVLILLALTILFSRNSGVQNDLERTTRQIESARFAVDMLGEDLLHAGYFGEFNPNTLTNAPVYQTPDPCATTAATQGWNTGVTPIQVPAPVQGIAAGIAVACLANRVAGTEAIVVRHADTGAAIAIADANANDLYLQIARCVTDLKRVQAATVPEGLFTARRPDCATVNDSLRRLLQRTYYIASCNDCAPSDGIPTLKGVEWINNALRTASVAEGVENLQVEYGIDTDGDGRPNNFSTTGAGAANAWPNVVAVRLHLLTRSTQATPGYTDTRVYQIGPGAQLDKPSDGFKRTLTTTTVRLNNVGGRRE